MAEIETDESFKQQMQREREREKMGRRREVEQGNEKRINSNDRKKT